MIGFGIDLATLCKGALFHDFRASMPVGSTYTRTGAATALTGAGTLQTFAADEPQRTDRGLALEPARTNILLGSTFAGGGSAPTQWSQVLGGGVSEPVESDVLGTAYGQTAVAERPFLSQTVTLAADTDFTFSVFIEATGGAPGVAAFMSNGPAGLTTDYLVNPAVGRHAFPITTTNAGSGRMDLGLGGGEPVTASLTFSNPQLEAGTFATSPIPTTGATATRDLPVFTEPVPAGHTRALLTYADATTTLVTGLTPGDTFEYAETVIAAGKGRFGASELVSRTWLP